MTNAELNEATFVLAGYAVFMWIYYILIKKWVLKEEDKCTMLLKGYVSVMFALPTAIFVLAVLVCLYSALFEGVAR